MQMSLSIKLLAGYQFMKPQSLVIPTAVRGSLIEASPRFVKVRKAIRRSFLSTKLNCNMNDISLHEGVVGVDYKDGVVVVDHGSRRNESNLFLNEFVTMFRNKTGYPIAEPAHMELAESSIKDAFCSCVEQGATRVIISPFFLFPGRHWYQDIPSLAEEVASEYPGIPYIVTAPLGLHDSLVDVAKDRIDYCLSHVAGKVEECKACAGSGRCKMQMHDF